MPNESNETSLPFSAWPPKVVYGMAAGCLLLGLLVGYLSRGSRSSVPSASAAAEVSPPPQTASGVRHPAATLEQMKQLADQQARPALEQLKKDPRNKDLLIRVARVYTSTHQFQEAASYFAKALELDPKDARTRTEMASCLYYSGDVEGALAQLEQSLKYEPKNANSLFNLGMIKWKGKNDPAGAIQTWQELLRAHPNLDRRAVVEKMIAEARQQGNLN